MRPYIWGYQAVDLPQKNRYTIKHFRQNERGYKGGGSEMPEIEVGKVSTFFARPVVAGIDLTAPVKVGDKIHIKGHTTDVEVTVESMQIHNVNVQEAKAGDSIGIKVPDRVRSGDHVYKVTA
jgi:translation initiation factor IF-2